MIEFYTYINQNDLKKKYHYLYRDFKRFAEKGYLHILIHCSSLHQDKKQSDTGCQVAFRPDEMNCNVHETLAFNNVSSHGDNPRR